MVFVSSLVHEENRRCNYPFKSPANKLHVAYNNNHGIWFFHSIGIIFLFFYFLMLFYFTQSPKNNVCEYFLYTSLNVNVYSEYMNFFRKHFSIKTQIIQLRCNLIFFSLKMLAFIQIESRKQSTIFVVVSPVSS